MAKKSQLGAAVEKMADMAKKLAASESFQAEAMKNTNQLHFGTWASAGGCAKRRRSKFGSTCCSPGKIEAMRRACEFKRQDVEAAGQVYKDGEPDLKVYRQQLENVYIEIASARCLLPPPSYEKPEGV